MSSAQRLVFLGIAIAIAIAGVVVIGIGGDDDGGSTTVATGSQAAAATSTPGASTGAVTTPAPAAPKPPLLKAGSVKTITVSKGDTVTFRAINPTAEEVHVHGYDKAYDLEPGKERTISFTATLDGQFEIELEGTGTKVATLRVEP